MFSPDNIEKFMAEYQYIKDEVHRRKIPPKELVLSIQNMSDDPLFIRISKLIVALDEGINDDTQDKENFLRRTFLKALDVSLQELLREERNISLETVRARNQMLAFFAEAGKK